MQVQRVTPELLVGGIGTSGDFYRNALGLELELLYNVKGTAVPSSVMAASKYS